MKCFIETPKLYNLNSFAAGSTYLHTYRAMSRWTACPMRDQRQSWARLILNAEMLIIPITWHLGWGRCELPNI